MLHLVATTALLLASCTVTGGAGELRHCEARLRGCIVASVTREQRRECLEDSRVRCVRVGLAPECARDDFESDRRE